MVLFVGVHRPERGGVPAFRFSGFPVFRSSGCSGFPVFPVFRVFGGSGLPDNRGFGVPVCGFSRFRFRFRFRPRLRGRSCSSGPLRPPMHLARLRVLSAIRTRGASDASLRASAAHLLFRMPSGCRLPIPPRGVACSAALPAPGAVSGCRRCPRSGGAACASGACRRSSAPPLRARSPGRARAWRSTTARRRSP